MAQSIPYAESYVGRLRQKVGNQKLILVTTRAVVRDQDEAILFVRRSDNSQWVMPSGSLELDETLFESMQREVREESGLEVIEAQPMGLYTTLHAVTSYGDPFTQISLQFLVSQWRGQLHQHTDETTAAAFFPIDAPPPDMAAHYNEVLEDLRAYRGDFIFK
ncbi:MAG: NUDIX domain-containing protein [Candidatus Latescibacteria bacterium]|nr:NUDIX domain-containing protein [Candidatus Latescibacterota bacterium]